MRKSGEISAHVLKEVLDHIKIGVSGLEVDHLIEKKIVSLGGEISFRTVSGYKWASCITINEQVVHGIPTDRKFQQDDIVSVDLGVIYRGWHTDCAWTVLVSGSMGQSKVTRLRRNSKSEEEEKKKFLQIGEHALWDGIANAVEGKRIGDISSAIQKKVESAGYFVVRALVGHGVGRTLHEEPEVPGYGEGGTGLILKKGMTLAIEVIYAKGTSEVVLEKDGWTYTSADGSWAGLFEMTVIVGKERGEVLTDWRSIPHS